MLINRGYSLSCFEEAVSNLNTIGIDVVCHLIFGLPGENKEDMQKSVEFISHKKLQGVKLHLLHVLEGTVLAQMYKAGEFNTLSIDEYVELVVRSLELLPPDFVIHRLTGDGPKNSLIAPEWSKNKREVLNRIEKELNFRNIYQGSLWNQYI